MRKIKWQSVRPFYPADFLHFFLMKGDELVHRFVIDQPCAYCEIPETYRSQDTVNVGGVGGNYFWSKNSQ